MATTVLGLKTFAASDPVDYNEINDNYNKIDSGVKTALQGRAAHNLLDNSDFTNPVNQRGKTSYSTSGNEYTIDRWKTQYNTGLTIESGYINVIGGWQLYQVFKNPKDGVYTFAVEARINSIGDYRPNMDLSGKKETLFDANIGEWKIYTLQYDVSSITDENISFSISARGGNSSGSISVKWAAMYKGAYTADTLPAYQPKGYTAELAECQRYYENSWFGVGKTATQEYFANVWSSTQADARIEFKQQKRISPTITFYPIGTESNWKIFNNGYNFVDSVENKGRGGLSGFIARVSKGSSDSTTWTIGDTIQAQGHWEASADL